MEKEFEEEKYKQVIHYTVSKLCEELQQQSNELIFSKQAIATIAEITFRQSQTLALDLESFAHHAKRKRITTDDVLLCSRKSPDLQHHLEDFRNKLSSTSGNKK